MLATTVSLSLLVSLPSLVQACVGQAYNQQYNGKRQVASDAIPLASISPSMTIDLIPVQTHAAGAQPSLAGSPVLPSYTAVAGAYPTQDVTPPVDSDEVKAWVAAIDWTQVPDYTPNVGPNLCSDNPAALADTSRCWWSCGQCNADTDIVTCPEKNTWGTSFDDGPSTSTPTLLAYLEEHSLKTTFFVIGSRIIGQPDVLRDEHMRGHEIAGHSWSHPQLTTLTNEQIVAELGWTRKLIKDIIGVTTLTFRPPQGDIDNRVRAIAAQMNLTPVMWSGVTGAPDLLFDSLDFNAQAAILTPAQAFGNWTAFLDTNLPKMETGFVSLEHDLYPLTVTLATNYFLPDALGRTNPSLKLTSIIECQGKTIADAYLETNNGTLPGGGEVVGTTAGGEGASSSAAVGGSGSSATATVSGSATRSASASATGTAAANTGGAGARIAGGKGVGAVVVGLVAGVVGVLAL
ncbi:hypothetical protein BDY24DRAFT_170772 [Mrakia frigida]|uniref:uncharacterized protein n=1 Tax=Mrakia frigida TaxID=29902 RepID=UPI003FCBF265